MFNMLYRDLYDENGREFTKDHPILLKCGLNGLTFEMKPTQDVYDHHGRKLNSDVLYASGPAAEGSDYVGTFDSLKSDVIRQMRAAEGNPEILKFTIRN